MRPISPLAFPPCRYTDGFVRHSIVVGAETVTGLRANLLQAAYQAGELALRSVKAGSRNWEVTDALKGLYKEYEESGVKGVEGILSHQVRLFASTRLPSIFAAATEGMVGAQLRCH